MPPQSCAVEIDLVPCFHPQSTKLVDPIGLFRLLVMLVARQVEQHIIQIAVEVRMEETNAEAGLLEVDLEPHPKVKRTKIHRQPGYAVRMARLLTTPSFSSMEIR